MLIDKLNNACVLHLLLVGNGNLLNWTSAHCKVMAKRHILVDPTQPSTSKQPKPAVLTIGSFVFLPSLNSW